LGHLTRKNRPEMTYNVFIGTLDPTHFTCWVFLLYCAASTATMKVRS